MLSVKGNRVVLDKPKGVCVEYELVSVTSALKPVVQLIQELREFPTKDEVNRHKCEFWELIGNTCKSD